MNIKKTVKNESFKKWDFDGKKQQINWGFKAMGVWPF